MFDEQHLYLWGLHSFVTSRSCSDCRQIEQTGGTRFIGVYLARQLVEAGHEVTLLTRGKNEVTYQIPDDTDESYNAYKSAVKHIAADRKDKSMLDSKLAGKKFDGGVG